MSLDNAFRVTANGQFVQDVNLAPGTYTLNCCVNSPNSNYYCRLYNGSDIVNLSTPITPGTWDLAVITFTLTKTMTKFEIARNGSTLYPVLVGRPMFENGNNASTARPSELDLLEELESVDSKYGEKVIELSGRLTQTEQSLETEYTKKTEMSSYVDGVKQTVQTDYNTKFTQTAQQIASKVAKADFDEFGNAVNSDISEITQKADEIELSVDDLLDDLEATGIKIEQKKIEVTAPSFIVKQPDGNPVAVFNENFLLDNYGNMRIKSLRTPFELKNQWGGVDFDVTPNVILTNFTGSGDLILPTGEKYNGQHINIIWDMLFDTDIAPSATLYKLKPYGTGKFFRENGEKTDVIRLSTRNRTFLGLIGFWYGGVLNWVVSDRVNRNVKPESFKAGDTVCSFTVTGSVITVLKNNLPSTPTAVVNNNILGIVFPSFTVLNDSGSQVVRTLNTAYLKVVPEADSYTQATVVSTGTVSSYGQGFLIKRISRTNIASTSAAAVNISPGITISLVATQDFSAFYETI